MGSSCCKLLRCTVCAKPMRFWGIHNQPRSDFRRLSGDTPSYITSVCLEAPSQDEIVSTQLPGTLTKNSEIDDNFHEYIDFPFLTDNELGQWITNTRFMIILRGPPGSGKSYLASCIKKRFPSSEICSADYYWYLSSGGREYQFDCYQLNDAHTYCQENATKFASLGVSPLIIDNTNIRAWECRFYTELARKFDYNVILAIPNTPWRFDLGCLASRNIHNVPPATIESKIRQFEPVYPVYYGWFWPSLPSRQAFSTNNHNAKNARPNGLPLPYPCSEAEDMINSAYDAFMDMLNLDTVRAQLAETCGFNPDATPSELAVFWSSAVSPTFGKNVSSRGNNRPSRAHLTSMFSGMGRFPGSEEYSQRRAVTEALLGKVDSLQVLGLFVTRRSVGLRVRFEPKLLELWNGDDNQRTGNQSSDQPNRHPGSRAHVTLALAAGVPAVETGLDLLRIVDSETIGCASVSNIVMSHGLLHDIKLSDDIQHVYYYEFSRPRAYRVCFGAYY